MDAQQFMAHFGHIANSPEGVARLRELVLSLAFTGRLCAPSADSVEVLIEEIERQRAVGKVETRNQRLARERARHAIVKGQFTIPSSWRWISLSAVGHAFGQKIPSEDFYYIDVSSIENKAGILAPAIEVISASSAPVRARKIVKKGALIYSTVRPYLLNVAVIDRDFDKELIASTAFAVIYPWRGIEARYLYHYLRSPYFVRYVEFFQTGMAYPAISEEKFYAGLVPVPPTEEQGRIVAKIDELMALCDHLEQQRENRRKLQNALRQSTLQAAASAQETHELQASWSRLQTNFGRLFSEPMDVDDIVAELKNLSVRGVLVEVSRSEADLENIKADCSAFRSDYIAKGLMRRQKLASMAENEVTYPGHWAVAAFDEVAVVIGGVTKGRDMRGKQVVVRPYLSVANVQRGYFKLDNLKSIEIAEDELEKYLVHDGDLLVTEGGDWDKVGRTAIWKGGVDNCLHQNHVFKARVPSEQLLNAWVELVFNSSVGRDYFAGASKQTTNLASINMTQLRSFPLPIPPLEEQRRILETLTALTDLCEEWRGQLVRKRDLASLFATASIASLTGISIEEDQDTAVKAPKTQLIAPLRLGKAPSAKTEAPLARELARHNGEMSANDLWQRFGGEIDAFYAQLKHEVAQGWIQEPAQADVQVIEA